jgi:hypothetical protein
MNNQDQDKDHYFGEWVPYDNENDKEEIMKYFQNWKRYLLRKLPDLQYIEEWIIDKPINTTEYPSATIGIKIQMKGKKPRDVISLDQRS